MMKLVKTSISILALLFSQFALSTAYDDDQANFYVEGQSLNNALTQINQIMCFVSNMRADAFVNAGPYSATIYEEDCTTGKSDTSGDSSSATATSASSSTTASSTTSTTTSSKTATTAVLNVTRLSSVSPVKAKTWVSSKAQSDDEFDQKIYVDTTQSGGVTATSPNGDFTMRFSMHADGSQDVFGGFDQFGVEDGMFLGQGYLSAKGSTLKYKEYSQGQEGNVVAFFKTNGDKSGVYGEYAGFMNWDWETQGDPYQSMSPEEVRDLQINIFAYYQYYLSAADKGFCRRLFQAEKLDFPKEAEVEAQWTVNDAYWQQAFEDEQAGIVPTEYTEDLEGYVETLASIDVDGDGTVDPYNEDPWAPTETIIYDVDAGTDNLSIYADNPEFTLVVGEECFTTDRAKAQRNVWRYGVYNADGSRLDMAAGGFPLIAFVEKTFPDGNTGQVPIHAWADYWGVHVDPRGRSLITDDLEFVRESFDSSATEGAEQTYTLRPQDLRIEKRTTSYISLNSIDGLTLAMHVNDWWWLNEYKSLFGTSWNDSYDEYEGSFDADTSTFTWTKGISFRQGYNATDLETPVSFTVADWQSTMIKEWGKTTTINSQTNETVVTYEDWYHKETRNLGVWSHDTRQWYEISNAAMTFPTYTDDLVYQKNDGSIAAAEAGVTYEGRGAYKGGIRTESTDNVSVADVAADMTTAGASKLYCIRECLDSALVQQTFTDALNENYNQQYVSTPYADVGEYLKADITYSEVDRGFRSLGEATSNFTPASSLTTNTSKQIKLGKEVFAVTDYVSADSNLQLHSRGDGWTYNDCDDDYSSSTPGAVVSDYDSDTYCIQKMEMYSWDGFNVTNLNKLLEDSSNAADHGIAPSLHFDLKEIPAAGTSGTMKMIVTLYEGEDDERDGTEMSLSSEATLNWSSDGSKFTVTIPETSSTTMTLITSGGQAVTGTYGNSNVDSYAYGGGVISTGTADDGAGISWKVFRIFGGHHAGLNDLYSLGNLDSFFTAGGNHNGRYTATIQIVDTDLAIVKENRDWETWDWENDTGTLTASDPFRYAALNFNVYEDSTVLRTESRMAGEYAEGLELADMWYYTVSGTSVLDQNGVALSKGAANSQALSQMENPEQALQGKQFQTRDGWSQEVAWGIRTGELVLDTDLSKMECRKNGQSGSETYENHPVYGTSTANTRYCGNKLWEGAVDTKYNISMESRPSFEVIYANAVATDAVIGEVVDITEPMVMYYEVPETVDANGNNVFGKDAGKRIRLEYAGFGELWGIPGFVFDTATGEDLGEFVNDWKPTYRYLNRFTIPDGSLIENATDATITYKIKALDGEEWLTKADGTVTVGGSVVPDLRGSYTALYEGTKDDLVPDQKLRAVGPLDWDRDGCADNLEEFIGAEPTATAQTATCEGYSDTPALIESGKTCVVQGEVFCGVNAGT